MRRRMIGSRMLCRYLWHTNCATIIRKPRDQIFQKVFFGLGWKLLLFWTTCDKVTYGMTWIGTYLRQKKGDQKPLEFYWPIWSRKPLKSKNWHKKVNSQYWSSWKKVNSRCVLLKLIVRKARDVEKCKEFVVSLAKIKNGSFATIPRKRRERK